MTFDEALRELDVDASTPPEDARRAYLRLLKTRKPEVDPAGFQRLREAYEIVKQGPSAPIAIRVGRRAPVPQPPIATTRAADARPAPTSDVDPPPEPAAEPPPPVRAPSAADPAPIIALVHAHQYEAAARKLCDAFEEGVRSFVPCNALVPVAIDVILLLHGNASLDASLALGRSVHRYLGESVGGARAIGASYVTKWAVARELDSLPRDFPEDLRGAFARAVLDSDPSRAFDVVFAFQRANRARAHDAAVALGSRAPLLARWYSRRLSPSNGGSARFWQSGAGRWGVLAIVLSTVVRLFASEAYDALRAPESRPAPTAAPPPHRDADIDTSNLTAQVLDTLASGDCDAARHLVVDLSHAREGASAPVRKRAGEAIARVRAECPVHEEGGAP